MLRECLCQGVDTVKRSIQKPEFFSAQSCPLGEGSHHGQAPYVASLHVESYFHTQLYSSSSLNASCPPNWDLREPS